MEKYLKKKRLYGLTSQLLADKKLPILKNCEYRFSHGAEWGIQIPFGKGDRRLK